MKLIDTHAHLDSVEDIDGALVHAYEAGVSAVVAVGEDQESNRKNLAAARRTEVPRIILALGIHPSAVGRENLEESFTFIEEHLNQARAIGEIGLDFWYKWVRKDKEKKDAQRAVYRRLLETAKAQDLPALIHTRGTWREAFETARGIGVHKAVFHWYSGPVDVLEDILNAGYFVSASPSVAYSPESRRAMEIAPVEQTLIETDSPVYYKHCDGGLKAGPKDIFCTLKYYAELKQRPARELADILNRNARRIFGIDDSLSP